MLLRPIAEDLGAECPAVFNIRKAEVTDDIFDEAVIESMQSLVRGSELRSCVKVEVAVLGSPTLVFLMAFVVVKQH